MRGIPPGYVDLTSVERRAEPPAATICEVNLAYGVACYENANDAVGYLGLVDDEGNSGPAIGFTTDRTTRFYVLGPQVIEILTQFLALVGEKGDTTPAAE